MKIKSCIIAAVSSAILSSCSSVYMPNVPATPMFSKKGEFYAAAHTNWKGNLSGNFGVALGNHVAVIGNGSYIDYEKGNTQFKQHLYEGGLGYFTTFGAKRDRILEFYGGYGVGSTREADTRATTVGMQPVEWRQLNFEKIFVQSNFSRRRERIKLFGREREFNYGTVVRASFVRSQDLMVNDIPVENEENLFIEPMFFTRMQLNKSFQLQYTNGFNIGVVDNQYLKPGNAVFTLGIIYKLSR